jgi:acylphosphatase
MATAHVFISGFVQGVGYRAFVKKHATELGLTGWVKNLPDGRVEAMFQGKKETIEKMVELCKKGPFMAEVEDVEVLWEDSKQQLSSFQTLRE